MKGLASLAPSAAPLPEFACFAGVARCPVAGHPFPAAAGACPIHEAPGLVEYRPRLLRDVPARAVAPLPPLLALFERSAIKNKDSGRAPRTLHAYGYDQAKLATVNHIPVCRADPATGRTGLDVLTDYFNGTYKGVVQGEQSSAKGSTHYGNGRELGGWLVWAGQRIPFSPVHQYMPITGAVSPWAQGIIQPGNCSYPLCALARRMRSGEPNGACISVENVAYVGTDGMSDPQFNSNVFLRACASARFGFPVAPETNLWHGEFDGATRCADPGWGGALEDAAQAAAVQLLAGDLSGLRAVERDGPTPPPPPPPPATDWEAVARRLAADARLWVRDDGAGAQMRADALAAMLKGTGL